MNNELSLNQFGFFDDDFQYPDIVKDAGKNEIYAHNIQLMNLYKFVESTPLLVIDNEKERLIKELNESKALIKLEQEKNLESMRALKSDQNS